MSPKPSSIKMLWQNADAPVTIHTSVLQPAAGVKSSDESKGSDKPAHLTERGLKEPLENKSHSLCMLITKHVRPNLAVEDVLVPFCGRQLMVKQKNRRAEKQLRSALHQRSNTTASYHSC
jgi:hypothetical protein